MLNNEHLASFNIEYVLNPTNYTKIQNFYVGDYNLLSFFLNEDPSEASPDFRYFVDEEAFSQWNLESSDYLFFVKKLLDKRLLLTKVSLSPQKKEKIFENFSRLSIMYVKYAFVFSFCFFMLLFKRKRILDGDFKGLENFSGWQFFDFRDFYLIDLKLLFLWLGAAIGHSPNLRAGLLELSWSDFFPKAFYSSNIGVKSAIASLVNLSIFRGSRYDLLGDLNNKFSLVNFFFKSNEYVWNIFFYLGLYNLCHEAQTFEESFCSLIEDREDFDFYLRTKHSMTYPEFNKSLVWLRDWTFHDKFPFLVVEKKIDSIQDEATFLDDYLQKMENFIFQEPLFGTLHEKFQTKDN